MVRFNPRSRAGSDGFLVIILIRLTSFNPRSRAGSDYSFVIVPCSNVVSIHAPARGATGVSRWMRYNEAFQSTLPRGERRKWLSFLIFLYRFQSTLPRGERRRAGGKAGFDNQFQSTLPRGERRILFYRVCEGIKVSIHAPARGATENILRHDLTPVVSIHAPARGATLCKRDYRGR